jgi:hypothetical protein
MDVELPAWMGKLLNLVGLTWTNAKADVADAVSAVYRSHGNNMQPVGATAKTHGALATSAVQGSAGTKMAEAVNHPQGPAANLDDHHKGALVTSLITGITAMGLRSYKMARIADGAVTAGEIAVSAATPGGQLVIPAQLGFFRLMQNALINLFASFLMGDAA